MTVNLPAIQLGAPGEEISKKDLHAVANRFKNFHQGRLQRVRDVLQPRQHAFLHLLPLLFHQNHTLLPGFVSLETPAGIPDYQPGKQALEAAKQFSKTYSYKGKALRRYPIYGLYLMGSVGSMAFSKSSDIDVWLCHAPNLAADELKSLAQKVALIEKWAATLKLEVHIFLVDSQRFKRGEHTPLSTESSGETQHYLLLEEFYRTAIYIAGRIPAWWLVPPAQEQDYARYVAHLLENRFIGEDEVIDFGGLEAVPESEFISSTLWHIYKSLSSPHKELLKLFLMESYAAELPAPQWLCRTMKQAVYQGDFSVDSLDPYLLIYGKVDAYLKQMASPQRLALARECFYIKILGHTPADGQNPHLLDDLIPGIAARWQWPAGLLENLENKKFWNIKRAAIEHGVIRDQLQQCLRIILKLVGNPIEQAQQNSDLKLVVRKLRAVLDLRPGKVELLTTRGMVQSKPDVWTLVQAPPVDKVSLWCLFDERAIAAPVRPEQAVKHSESLLELLCWAVLNGLYRRDVGIQLVNGPPAIAAAELKQLAAELYGFLSKYLAAKETGLQVYAQPNRLESSLLLLNWGEALSQDSRQQLVMSERADPLSYGENRYCFVQGVQKLSVSTWGEATLEQYRGLEGLLTCLTDIYNQSGRPIVPGALRVLCYTQGRGRSIASRVESIFARLLACFAGQPEQNYRYVLPAAAGYCCYKLQNNVLGFYLLENTDQLLQELGRPVSQFSPLVFDEYVLENSVLPFIYRYNQPGAVQIFYQLVGKQVAVYILDERGSLHSCLHTGSDPQHAVMHYIWFIQSLQLQAHLPDTLQIKCYEIQKNSKGVVSCHPTRFRQGDSALDLRVRISVDRTGRQTVYCNERTFVLSDEQAFQEAKNYIFSFRNSRDEYPFHITEIDVPCELLGLHDAQQAQSLHYLNFKQKIEEKLNH